MTKDQKHLMIYNEAVEAGMKAGNDIIPEPMHLVNSGLFGPLKDAKTYVIPEGPCGFAWIIIKPGTSSFAKWMKKNEYARKHYYGGLSYFVHVFGQSLQRKEAYAHAFAKVLRNYNINAYAESRID